MGFTVPNLIDASFPDQSRWFSTDIEILARGFNGDGVVSGCAVSQQGTPNMTVAVSSGQGVIDGTLTSVSSGNVTITTAHATLPRFDLIIIEPGGTKSAIAGTPAARPLPPALPTSCVALAFVYVPAADTAITDNQITDKRLMDVDPTALAVDLITVYDGRAVLATDFDVTNSATLTTVTGFTQAVTAGDVWEIEVHGATWGNNTTGDVLCDLVFTSGTMVASASFYQVFHFSSSGVLSDTGPGMVSTSARLFSSGLTVNNGDSVVRPLFLKAWIVVATTGQIEFQIANAAAASGRISRVKAGAVFTAQKVSP